jgi:type II secretory pathway predicted ATPase ExeA
LRKTASVPVWLRSEHLGPIWEEETEARVLSLHGAGLRSRHFVLTGSTLVVTRRDNGRRANARVRYCRYDGDGKRELGIEFIDEGNFWDLDWNSSEPKPPIITPLARSMEAGAESAPALAPAPDDNPRGPVGTRLVLPSTQETGEVVEIVPAQEAAEKEGPQTLLVAYRNEQPLSPDFLSFYGLNGQPFDVTPDPEYLYLSQTHRQALTSLTQGIQNVRGFMALIAGPGLGKTILLNKLMEDLRESTRIVFLFQTKCNSRELFRYLLSELGVDYAGMDVVTMHKALNEILFHEMLNGRRFVLIIDEAQNLHASVLETIRLLSDFESTHTKLIQIILSGQPRLVDTLLRPGLSQLRQRIAILTNLEPLSAADTAQYINHRLRMAGSSGEPIFTPDALTLIGEQSKGVPRIINNLCFNALLLGCSQGRNPIDAEIGQKVVARSDLESLVRRSLGPTLGKVRPSARQRAAS